MAEQKHSDIGCSPDDVSLGDLSFEMEDDENDLIIFNFDIIDCYAGFFSCGFKEKANTLLHERDISGQVRNTE